MDIVSDIEEKISKGVLKDGNKLPSERELSIQFKVSRTVVREAINVLREKGYVDVQMGRGAFITKPNGTIVTDSLQRVINSTNSKMTDILEVREELELAIIKKAVSKATKSNIDSLKKIFAKMEMKKFNINEFIEEDTNFHMELAKTTQNNIFYVLTSSFLDLTDKALFQVTKYTPFSVHEAQKQHWDIIQAIEMRDEVLAVKTILNHTQMIRDEIKMLQDQKVFLDE